ncbi:hypothetical protein CHARACLAT_011853 [Characodon lateralis]|uniref:Uncharacterized protein n=1 Tax=Characodon lateralis TaxID=208331 RepID=A0ABU7DS50_9TELE|nr:hypothetical protein [Characodon lateralis]
MRDERRKRKAERITGRKIKLEKTKAVQDRGPEAAAYRTRGSFTSNQLEQREAESQNTLPPLHLLRQQHAVQMDSST